MWTVIKDKAINTVTSLIHPECVADGNCPQRTNFVIRNNTKYELFLDNNEPCERDCNHKGKPF